MTTMAELWYIFYLEKIGTIFLSTVSGRKLLHVAVIESKIRARKGLGEKSLFISLYSINYLAHHLPNHLVHKTLRRSSIGFFSVEKQHL